MKVYAIDSMLGLLLYKKSIYFDLLRDCYEAWVIYQFFRLLLNYLGRSTVTSRLVMLSVCLQMGRRGLSKCSSKSLEWHTHFRFVLYILNRGGIGCYLAFCISLIIYQRCSVFLQYFLSSCEGPYFAVCVRESGVQCGGVCVRADQDLRRGRIQTQQSVSVI